MARIFLSHSSADNAQAVALRDWLKGQGWEDVFLDLDPERGIVAGQRWEKALVESARACEAVVLLISCNWLGSEWCLRELHLALRLNKQIFGVLVEDLPVADLPPDLTANFQVVNLGGGSDHEPFRAVLPERGLDVHVTFSRSGLERLRLGLRKAGLDPSFFDWPPPDDPGRPPWRGLKPLEAEDAGIFFGREAPIIEALDIVRGLAAQAPPRILVILGASGAGKSSFLRAGLWPRLMRDDRHVLPLAVIRPERAAVTGEQGLLASLEAAFRTAGLGHTRAGLRMALEAGGDSLAEEFERLCRAGVAEAEGPPPTLIVPIDQAEELFQAQGREEAELVLERLAELLARSSPKVILLFTIRSDAYEPLLTAKALDGLPQKTFPLPPLRAGAWGQVIEGPVERLNRSGRKLKLEPALTGQLLSDLETGGGKDALPLLSFTLERLYADYGGDGDLRLAEYKDFGGLTGAIDAAVAAALRAADSDPGVPKDDDARKALLRRALIPWLVGIDPDTGAPRRYVARYSEIPKETRPLVRHLVDQRLLSTDLVTLPDGSSVQTIEPAHEALMRQWSSLEGWLKEDAASLTLLEGVRRATRDWLANARNQAWLVHRAGRLEDAERLHHKPDLAAKLDPEDHSYLAACRTTETQERDKALEEARKLAEAQKLAAEQQKLIVRRTRIGAIAVLLFAFASLAAALWGWQKQLEANTEKAIAIKNETQALVALSKSALEQGRTNTALKLALASANNSLLLSSTPSPEVIHAIANAVSGSSAKKPIKLPTTFASIMYDAPSFKFSPDGTSAVAVDSNGFASVWDASDGTLIRNLGPTGGSFREIKVAFLPDGCSAVAASARLSQLIIWPCQSTETKIKELDIDIFSEVTLSDSGALLATSSLDSGIEVWNTINGTELKHLTSKSAGAVALAFSPDDRLLAQASKDKSIAVWDISSGKQLFQQTLSEVPTTLSWSPQGESLIVLSKQGSLSYLDVSTGLTRFSITSQDSPFLAASHSPNGKQFLTLSSSAIRLWDSTTGTLQSTFQSDSNDGFYSALFVQNDTIITLSNSSTLALWLVATQTRYSSFKLSSDGASDDGQTSYFSNGSPSSVIPSADRSRLAIYDRSQRIILFDTSWLKRSEALEKQGQVLASHEGEVYESRLSPDNKQFVTASADGTSKVVDILSRRLLFTLTGHNSEVVSARYNNYGTRIVTASADGTAKIWDTHSGRELLSLKGHKEYLHFAIFSPSGDMVLTGSGDNTAKLWSAEDGRLLTTWELDSDVTIGAFSPSGDLLAIANSFGYFRVISTESQEVIAKPKSAMDISPSYKITALQFSPDGQVLLTATESGYAYLWNANDVRAIKSLRSHTDAIWSASFSSNGQSIITSSSDKTAILWNVNASLPLIKFIGHTHDVTSAFLTEDMSRAVTTSFDETIRVWDAATGANLAIFQAHSYQISDLSLSSDGETIVAAFRDGTVRIWSIKDVERGSILDIACGLLGGDVSMEQIKQSTGISSLGPICMQ